MASYRLDETANFPQSTARTIEDYARACSKAVDEAVEEWPIVATTENARVSTGFVGDNRLMSTLDKSVIAYTKKLLDTYIAFRGLQENRKDVVNPLLDHRHEQLVNFAFDHHLLHCQVRNTEIKHVQIVPCNMHGPER